MCSTFLGSIDLFLVRSAGAAFGFYPLNGEPEKTSQQTTPQWCFSLKRDIIICKGFVSTFLWFTFSPLSSIHLSIRHHCFLGQIHYLAAAFATWCCSRLQMLVMQVWAAGVRWCSVLTVRRRCSLAINWLLIRWWECRSILRRGLLKYFRNVSLS